MTEPRRVLVLTERFPPDVCGGAELSLADTLGAVDSAKFVLKVVALASVPIEKVPDLPYEVLRLGRVSSWPPGRREIYKKLGGPENHLHRLTRFLRINLHSAFYILRRRRFWRGLAQLASIDRQNDAVGGDNNFAVSGDDDLIGQVQAEIDRFKPDIIHADNLFGIMVSARCNPQKGRRVSVVRDNRFFCAHARQKMVVDDVACVVCKQQCVSEPSLALKALFKKELGAIRADREAALRKSDAILTTSKFLEAQITDIIGPRIIHVIGNPLPLDIMANDCADRSTGFNVLFVGALERRKGAHLVAEVMLEVSRAVPDVTFSFAGEGALEAYIAEKAIVFGMSERVSLLGFVDRKNLKDHFATSAVVVTPTLWPEPFGRVPLEAGIAERPIIASDAGGHRETVVDGETGLLVRPSSKSDLQDAIITLLQDPIKARRMGKAGRQYVCNQFSLGEVARRLQEEWSNN